MEHLKGLHDKTYDKRKASALELEKIVKEAKSAGDEEKIAGIVSQIVTSFDAPIDALNTRNGLLIATAAVAIALGSDITRFLTQLLPPILKCTRNSDAKVRYYACESLYNVCKVAKADVLPHFPEIWDSLTSLSAEHELYVKSGIDLMDRLLKDIVSEFASNDSTPFELAAFIPLLQDRIYVISPFTRTFLVSWLKLLNSVPDMRLVRFVPDFLDGLLRFLDDPNKEVKDITSVVLAELLHDIKEAAVVLQKQNKHKKYESPVGKDNEASAMSTPSKTEVAVSRVASAMQRKLSFGDSEGQQQDKQAGQNGSQIVGQNQGPGQAMSQVPRSITGQSSVLDPGSVEHSTPVNPSPKRNSLNGDSHKDVASPERVTPLSADDEWVSKAQIVPIDYSAVTAILIKFVTHPNTEIQATVLKWLQTLLSNISHVLIPFVPFLLPALLPCLAHASPDIASAAKVTNQRLFDAVKSLPSINQDDVAIPQTYAEPSVFKGSQQMLTSESPVQLPNLSASRAEVFDSQTTVTALTRLFSSEHEDTRVATLQWLSMLHGKVPKQTFSETFPALLHTLSDPSEEVVRADLLLLSQISSSSDVSYFIDFIDNLVKMFIQNPKLLETRASLVVRQLCESLGPEKIMRIFATVLERTEHYDFASSMIQVLNMAIMTSPELKDLRARLKNLDSKDGQALFSALYKPWCHNPVSVFSLCLLSQAYDHASQILQCFADLEMTVGLLIQLDHLVQLLESPIFTFLRLQLLEPDRYPALYKCLYGIMMLLPQSSAFNSLQARLGAVSNLTNLNVSSTNRALATPPSSIRVRGATDWRWPDMLQYFKNVLSKHQSSQNDAKSNPQKAQGSRNESLHALPAKVEKEKLKKRAGESRSAFGLPSAPSSYMLSSLASGKLLPSLQNSARKSG